MTHIRVKGFQIFADRHGTMRCYHRKTHTSVNLDKAPLGSAEFFAECARIAELTKKLGPPKPGTLGLLIGEYWERAIEGEKRDWVLQQAGLNSVQ